MGSWACDHHSPQTLPLELRHPQLQLLERPTLDYPAPIAHRRALLELQEQGNHLSLPLIMLLRCSSTSGTDQYKLIKG